jgi:voltage-gated potassium channel
MSSNKPLSGWRFKLHEIIYEADTPLGKLFDVVLFIVIISSIVFVMLESVESIDSKIHNFLNIAEWVVTILFTIEYIARIIAVRKPAKYIFSFYGIIDLLATIPKYLSLILAGSHSLVALRALRLMRVFRILKLARYIGASTNFVRALKASRVRILVFLSFVIILCIILGTIMYLIENEMDSGFTSIPESVYWAIVTLTTVGYGDIAPVTPLGQAIAALIMIIGYSIIVIPLGIVSNEMNRVRRKDIQTNTQSCPNCLAGNHKDKAIYCYACGAILNDEQ